MAVGPSQEHQVNITSNKSRNMFFFENAAGALAYNYKTEQWTLISAYASNSLFSINSKTATIGLIRKSSLNSSVELQSQLTSSVAKIAIIETGAADPNKEGRTVITGVRPLVSGGVTVTVRVGVQDSIGGAVTYSSVTTPHTRTGMAAFRSEGRYVRIEVTLAGGFTTVLGADIDFTPQGKV